MPAPMTCWWKRRIDRADRAQMASEEWRRRGCRSEGARRAIRDLYQLAQTPDSPIIMYLPKKRSRRRRPLLHRHGNIRSDIRIKCRLSQSLPQIFHLFVQLKDELDRCGRLGVIASM